MAGDDNVKAIRKSLEKAWQDVSLQSNCSGFLKAVANDQNIGLEGRANDIISFIQAHWTLVSTAALAEQNARNGVFVVALLRGPDHEDKRVEGHVAIVLPGPLQARGSGTTGGSYPLVWCGGGMSGKSDGTRTVGDVWRPGDRNKVKYYKYVPR